MITVRPNLIVFIVILFSLLSSGIGYGQELSKTKITVQQNSFSPAEIIELLETESQLSFIYNPADLSTDVTLQKNKNYSIEQLLDRFMSSNSLEYTSKNGQIVLFQKPKEIIKPSFTINGYIEDFESKERLIGSHILDNKIGKGTVSNDHGFFSLTVQEGQLNLQTSYIGYLDKSLNIQLDKDTTVIIALKPDTYINEIEIVGRQDKITERSEMSQTSLTQQQLNSNPAFLGENDVLKTISTLPGVSTTNNVNSGLIVRGGGPDQNLILLDGVSLYNISHLFGLFSIFNSDVVKTSSLIKGAFPARYGGRLSSILDIRMNDGDLEQIHGTGTINLIASKLTLQGPLNKGKTSFLLSGRRTYADLIIKPIINVSSNRSDTEDKIIPTFNFYDTYLKLQHIINAKHRLFASFYTGRDNYGFDRINTYSSSSNQIRWGNDLASIRWNWEINNKLFLNTSVNYLNYNQKFNFGTTNELPFNNVTSVGYESGITDLSLRLNFDFVPNPEHYIRYGISVQQHDYKPGESRIVEEKNETAIDTSINRKNITSTEINAFIEDDFKLGDFNINAGLHLSTFTVEQSTYASLQPRISVNYSLSPSLALKASYSKMSQYNYLVTSETSLFISDLWVSSTSKIKPQNSWQVATGVSFSQNENIEISLESYYKYMKNVLSFKEGIENTLGSTTDNWENELIQGVGQSYGLELFAKKNEGRLNGWMSYALSWNWREFDDINDGQQYPFKYDSRHQFTIIGNYQFSKKVNLSVQWNYATGGYSTIPHSSVPTSFILNMDTPLFINSSDAINRRNNYQLSNSHRLDFTISFTKQKKRHTRIWSFGLYNAYNNRNPMYVTTSIDYDPFTADPIKRFKEVSLFPIIPSISYRFEF